MTTKPIQRRHRLRHGFQLMGLLWLLCCVSGGIWLLCRSNVTASPLGQSLHTKKIEEVKVGDYVLSRDQNDRNAPANGKRVEDVFRRTADHLRLLTLRGSNGSLQELKTTNNHPFWVEGQGWVKAGELQVWQKFTQAVGGVAVLESTAREDHPEGVLVCNFKVEGSHTYFVSAQNSTGPPVWVHNAECHLVYQLVDDAGSPIYYGKTQTTRFASTLRRHSFVNPKPFSGLQILAEGLTETEALSLESHLINQGTSSGQQLLNVQSKSIGVPLPWDDVSGYLRPPTQSYFPVTKAR